ncbi:hypothetical protein D9M68_751300 [compost metagenome]
MLQLVQQGLELAAEVVFLGGLGRGRRDGARQAQRVVDGGPVQVPGHAGGREGGAGGQAAVAVAALRRADAQHDLAAGHAVEAARRRRAGRDELQVFRGVEGEAAHGLALEHGVEVGHVLREPAAGLGRADVGRQLRVDEEAQAVHARRGAADFVQGRPGRGGGQRQQQGQNDRQGCAQPARERQQRINERHRFFSPCSGESGSDRQQRGPLRAARRCRPAPSAQTPRRPPLPVTLLHRIEVAEGDTP